MSLGRYGEHLARQYLEECGLRFRSANVRIFCGEIDLVMEDSARGELVFVEVRTRTGTAFGAPEESFTERKRRALHRSIQGYVNRERWAGPYRLDVVGVQCAEGRNPRITHTPYVALT